MCKYHRWSRQAINNMTAYIKIKILFIIITCISIRPQSMHICTVIIIIKCIRKPTLSALLISSMQYVQCFERVCSQMHFMKSPHNKNPFSLGRVPLNTWLVQLFPHILTLCSFGHPFTVHESLCAVSHTWWASSLH